jgi:GNAT superfamily N-acetyltransferase
MHMTQNPYARHEVTASHPDIVLVRQFYRDIYVPEFPDSSERESLENMERYLEVKAEGWYQKNNYHILLYLDKGTPIAGSIIDYLAEPNVGVIEFLVVSSSLRLTGLGKQLLQWTEDTLNEDSRRAGYNGWAYIIAEVNDPFKLNDMPDSMDPFQRTMIWHRWGYKKISFPYVQPALSPDKEPVRNLLLLCKPGTSSNLNAIPSTILREAVFGYALWAMRIDNPNDNKECQEMGRYLAEHGIISLVLLAFYIGDASVRRLMFTDLTGEHRDELDVVLDIYAREFSDGPTSVPRELFKQALMSDMLEGKPFDYHLISIKTADGATPQGMASFFTFPGAGFGGYIVFDPATRGKGYLSEVITFIERRMVMDKKGGCGWYCECAPSDDTASIFKKRGFYEVDIIYRQPPLYGQPQYIFDEAPILHLMYKEFGDNFEPPRLSTDDFLCALSWIYRVIYQIDEPEVSEYYQQVRMQTEGETFIRWK